ncbi:hypothetical protein ACF1AB_16565 [Streptomyces sp. NPDC014846]|uniref:hypothetical protein n=1 Tax=Streptomyces sp. NPDC014846 TaxID=3364922 RepID=UPI00370328D1
MALEYRYRTVDFRPAPDGWRTAWITRDGLAVMPMPGWIVQEEVEHNDQHTDDGRPTGHRNVVAGRIEDNGIEPIECAVDREFWLVLGPGEAEPTSDEVAIETSRRYSDGRLKGLSSAVPCPTCAGDSHYVSKLDRYIHLDGSENSSCWLAITRGTTKSRESS